MSQLTATHSRRHATSGRTDYRDPELFSLFLEAVDSAVCELLHAQRQMMVASTTGGSPLRHDFEKNTRGPRGLEAHQQLHGEALVMCVRGLANVRHRPTEAQRRRLVELLTPYLLCEQVIRQRDRFFPGPLLFAVVSVLGLS